MKISIFCDYEIRYVFEQASISYLHYFLSKLFAPIGFLLFSLFWISEFHGTLWTLFIAHDLQNSLSFVYYSKGNFIIKRLKRVLSFLSDTEVSYPKIFQIHEELKKREDGFRI